MKDDYTGNCTNVGSGLVSLTREEKLIESQAKRIEELECERNGDNDRMENAAACIERLNAEANVLARDLAIAREALTKIMRAIKTPPYTNMSRAEMREIAADAIDHMQKQTQSGDS